jgi:hypothetical protein
MRSELGKECRKLFRKLMAVEFPSCQEDKGQIVPQGWYVWTQNHPSGLFFHIAFVIHSTRDSFVAEAGWSRTGRQDSSLSTGGKTGMLNKPGALRLPELWGYNGMEPWWDLVLRPEEHERAIVYDDDPIEACIPLVAPAVWDAGEKLKEHAFPVFEEIVRRHGSTAAT